MRKRFCNIFIIILPIFFLAIPKSFANPIFVNDLDVSAEMNHPTGVVFNKSGSKMFVAGFTPNNGFISQISLAVPFNTSSAQSSLTKNLGTFTNRVQDIKFNADGTKLFLLTIKNASNKNGVDIWTLSAPYDISNILTDPHTFIQFGNNTRGFDFNSDGTKMFVLESVRQTIDEYTLSRPYDISNIIKTGSIPNSPGDAFHQGFGLSSDGYKIFVVKADKNTNDPELNTIEEYNLTSPFDLTTATLNENKYTSETINKATLERIAGITFNFSQGANKLYYTDFHQSDLIREFDLPCAFGVISCPDPTKNKDDVAMVEAQAESAKKIIQHTTYPVLNRMDWLRRNKDQVNLSNQNIKYNFSNNILNSLTNTLIPIYLSSKNEVKQNKNIKWSFWSEGSISLGKVGDSLSSSSKDINTTGLTFGADRKYENNILKGVALRFGVDDIDIGRVGSALDMKSLSLSFYETRPRGENKYFDNLIGISFINSKLINNSGSVSTNGERDGKQIFGSISFRDVLVGDYLNFTPEFKLNYGMTHYSQYEETGASGLNLKFGSQTIGTLITTVGSSIDKKIELKSVTFVPYFDFDYSADISPSTKQMISYTSNNQSFILENISDSTHNIQSGIGFDLVTNYGLTIATKYLRDQSIGKSHKSVGSRHSDSFTFGLDYKTSKNSYYTVSIIDTSLNFSNERKLNLYNINVGSNYDLSQDKPEYGIYVSLSNQF